MLTTSYGYKKPEADDTGDVFFPAMEFNVQRLNDHSHTGTDTAIHAPKTSSITTGSTPGVCTGWAAVSGQAGTYSQTVTMPAGYTYDAVSMEFRLSTGEVIHPTVTRAGTSSYVIYINDNSKNVTALYSS